MPIDNLIVILHQARTGSHALTEIISAAGPASMPELMIRYKEPKFNYVKDSNPKSLINSVQNKMLSFSNDCGLVVKMIHWHWEQRYRRAGIHKHEEMRYVKQLFGLNAKYILLRRKDKVAQAVSAFCAKQTKVWSSINKVPQKILTVDDYDFDVIKCDFDYMNTIEANWSNLTRYIHFLPLFYEDVFGDNQEYWLDLISDHIGLRVSPIEHRKFTKTRLPIQETFEKMFKTDLEKSQSKQFEKI